MGNTCRGGRPGGPRSVLYHWLLTTFFGLRSTEETKGEWQSDGGDWIARDTQKDVWEMDKHSDCSSHAEADYICQLRVDRSA
jgi:hypothetical protein